MQAPIKREYRLVFGTNINQDTAHYLKTRVATILALQDFGRLVILFSSDGGSTDHATSLYGFFRALPVNVRFHNVGHVGSAAIPVFLAAPIRTCDPLARFFFHEYDWGFAERQTLKRIGEAVSRLNDDIKTASDILKLHTKPTQRLLKAMKGAGPSVILEPEEAKEIGMVSEIVEIGQTTPDGLPVSVWT
jgi:ATP-dependent protease ClpP protease subunit